MSRRTSPYPMLEKISALKRRLSGMHLELALDVCAAAAPKLDALAKQAYDAGKTVYGEARPPGTRGNALDLVESNRVRSSLSVVAKENTIKASASGSNSKGRSYAAILMGRYRILPNGRLPADWSATITETVYEEAAKWGGETRAKFGRPAR